MADRHPYVSSPGGLEKTLNHFKNAFPPTVNSNTLKKLGFAPNNESYVMNVLRFLNFIDENDKKTDAGATVFSNHDNNAFEQAFAANVEDAYSGLFELHDEQSWNLDKDALISFFRTTDQTTAIVGQRQAATFQLLARFAGRGNAPQPRTKNLATKRPKAAGKTAKKAAKDAARPAKDGSDKAKDARETVSARVGLTVRIEINLPASGDQDTYDRIFRSIRENLLND